MTGRVAFLRLVRGWSFTGICALALAPTLHASLDDPGPYQVATSDVAFTDAIYQRGDLAGRIYYPSGVITPTASTADTTRTNHFPLVAFMHGYSVTDDDYNILCTQIAGHGFVVASINTQTDSHGTMEPEALDTRSLLHWVDDEAHRMGSFLYRMTDDGNWSAVGHSMGGAALMYLIKSEKRVQLIIGMEPYRGSSYGNSQQGEINLQSFTGRCTFISGSEDTLVPPDGPLGYFTEAKKAARRIYYEGIGFNHFGPVDDYAGTASLTHAQQLQLHLRVVTGTLRAEIFHDENLYYELLGSGGADAPFVIQSGCGRHPILWKADGAEAGALKIGMAARFGRAAKLAFSHTAAATSPNGKPIGLAPGTSVTLFKGNLTDTGTIEVDYVPGAKRATYFQGSCLQAHGGDTRTEVEN